MSTLSTYVVSQIRELLFFETNKMKGPTEITILNTAHLHKPRGELTIGKPIANTNIYVLDDDENPVKIGEPGTMWTGGSGVTRGYLNLPELTASRYKIDKFTRDE